MAFNRSKYQASSMESIKKEEAKKIRQVDFSEKTQKGGLPSTR